MVGSPLPDVLVWLAAVAFLHVTNTALHQQLLSHPCNPLSRLALRCLARLLVLSRNAPEPHGTRLTASLLSPVGGVILPLRLEDICPRVPELRPMSLLRSGLVYRPFTPLTPQHV